MYVARIIRFHHHRRNEKRMSDGNDVAKNITIHSSGTTEAIGTCCTSDSKAKLERDERAALSSASVVIDGCSNTCTL